MKTKLTGYSLIKTYPNCPVELNNFISIQHMSEEDKKEFPFYREFWRPIFEDVPDAIIINTGIDIIDSFIQMYNRCITNTSKIKAGDWVEYTDEAKQFFGNFIKKYCANCVKEVIKRDDGNDLIVFQDGQGVSEGHLQRLNHNKKDNTIKEGDWVRYNERAKQTISTLVGKNIPQKVREIVKRDYSMNDLVIDMTGNSTDISWLEKV